MENKKASILYVDDEPENLSSFKLVFRKEYEIVTASSATDALEIMRQRAMMGEGFPVVITDQRMPQVTGVELLEQVANRYPDSIRMIISGYSDTHAMMQAINKGKVYSYMTKPWEKEELKLAIDQALEPYHVRLENRKLLSHLRQSEEKFSIAFMAAPIPICITRQADGLIVDANQQYEQLCGFTRTEILGKNTLDLDIWVDRNDREEIIGQLKSKGYLQNFPYELKDRHGHVHHILASVQAIQIQGESHHINLLLDITEQKMAEAKVISTMLETEDKERRRIASELHDGLGQHLATVSLALEAVAKEKHMLSQKTSEKLEVGINNLQKAIREGREIAHNLMPKAIEDFGYIPALETMLETLEDTLQTAFFHNLQNRLPHSLELSLFRITQEAVNNILKHASASKVTVQVLAYPDVLILTIEDNGKGFETKGIKANGGFGLNSMKRRANALKASLNIDSQPGHGTAISLQVPL